MRLLPREGLVRFPLARDLFSFYASAKGTFLAAGDALFVEGLSNFDVCFRELRTVIANIC